MRFADWLLTRAIPTDAERDMVLGDLREELARRGRVWYLREALSISAHALLRPVSAPREPRRSGDFFMRTLAKDVKYAWRTLIKRPLLTMTVALTLGLGLGANAAIFNMIDRLVLRPYPLEDPDRVVLFSETGPTELYKKESVSPANFYDWRAAMTTTELMSAYAYWDANMVERNQPERLQGDFVTSGFFEALLVRPALGRTFVRDDETFGRHHVVIISDALWKRRFDGDPAIVGRSVMVDGGPAEIVGVMAPRFNFPEGCDIWSPLSFDPKTPPPRNARYLTPVARLKPGKTLEDAQAEIGVIAARLARDYPEDRDYGVRTYTLTRGMLDEGTGPILSMWQVSAFVVLLIACANIANLLLARAGERRRETAVRLAIGASRRDVVRELLTESTLLALVSVPGAIGFAWLSLYAIRVSMPANILRFVPGFESLGPDFRLVGFTIAVALLTAAIFGLLPALHAARASVSETLKEGGRTATGRQLLRRALVIAEIAIALPLLVTAGLGALGTRQFLSGPQGYDPDGLLTMKVVLPDRAYPDAASQRLFVDKAIAAIEPIAGPGSVSVVNNPPASGGAAARRIDVDGHPAPDPNHLPIVDMRAVTPGYFSLMRIPIARGRDFTSADREESHSVAIISESMARKFWPNEDPIGRRFRTPADKTWITVVGVCGDIIHDWFNRHNVPTMYRPFRQQTVNYFGIMIRTPGDPASLAAPVRRALLGVDPAQPVFDVMTMRRALHERTIGLQYLVAVMTVFGGIALLLASVGLYALISYLVVQRRHEIGVRIALGASSRQVVRLTIGQALRLTIAGSAIGLLLSIALARVIQAGLLGIGGSDARVFAGFAAVLIGTALVAGYVPARRAASIDPMVALRTE